MATMNCKEEKFMTMKDIEKDMRSKTTIILADVYSDLVKYKNLFKKETLDSTITMNIDDEEFKINIHINSNNDGFCVSSMISDGAVYKSKQEFITDKADSHDKDKSVTKNKGNRLKDYYDSIINDLANNISIKDIAVKYGTTIQSIYRIKRVYTEKINELMNKQNEQQNFDVKEETNGIPDDEIVEAFIQGMDFNDITDKYNVDIELVKSIYNDNIDFINSRKEG